MAHLPPSTAIFSPSIARIAASTARDWNYIDSWLSAKFHGRTPPPFERNPDTLKVLLGLASLNESADESRDLLARTEGAALQQLKSSSSSSGTQPDAISEVVDGTDLTETLLVAIEDGLSKEGRAALDTMAKLAVQSGIAYPDVTQLGRTMVDLPGRAFELEQMARRIDILHRYLDGESMRMDSILEELQSDRYKPDSDMAKQNLEMQRKIKSMTAKLPELKDRVAALQSASTASGTYPTTEDIAKQEQQYLSLLAQKKELDAQLAYFQGIPTDTDLARSELDTVRSDLRRLTRRRDAVFEGLVERETPRKPT